MFLIFPERNKTKRTETESVLCNVYPKLMIGVHNRSGGGRRESERSKSKPTDQIAQRNPTQKLEMTLSKIYPRYEDEISMSMKMWNSPFHEISIQI